MNQWTLLIGTISLVYSISAGAIRPLVLDDQQRHEIFLTAAQSLFAVVVLSDREITWWQAGLLFLPFAVQLMVPAWRIEVAYVYLAMTVIWGFHYRRHLAVLLFRQEDPVVRGSAAQALGALGSPYSEDALLNVLRDEHTFVRVSAAHGLAQAGTRRSLDFLLDALAREEEKNVKTVLALAVGAVAERSGHIPPYAELKTDAAKWRQWLQK